MKVLYGPEYPSAVTFHGVRMEFEKETRFSRQYHSKEANVSTSISKFQDGTATVSFTQLQNEWPIWTEAERANFCHSCHWLGKQADFPDMLRLIMKEGNSDYWRSIASAVAMYLPQEEAYRLLLGALEQMNEHTANITQGISLTKHPEAPARLRDLLDRQWSHPRLWDDASFTNWYAFDALCCIQHLLDVGAPHEEFEDKVRKLSEHPCSGNRESCAAYLHNYYGWLPKPQPHAPFAP